MHTLLEAYGPDSIDLQSFEVHDTLDQRIWGDDKLKPEIRERLLEIADEFTEFLGVPVTVEDVIFTGSLANYNYSKYSDIDLHLVFDFADVNEDEELVRELMIAKKTVWNDMHDIRVKGAEVELYAQDTQEPHHATGVYSVTNDEWNTKPVTQRPQVDMGEVSAKASDMMAQIDHALTDSDCPASCLDTLKDKIKRMRQSGLDKGGEFSVENLAFKVMRRNGYLEKLSDKVVDATDQDLSLESESLIEVLLNEVPIRDIERVGKWDRPGAFSKKDVKLLTNPKAIEKIRRAWSKSPYTFDIYLLNVPKLNKSEYREYGPIAPESDVEQEVEAALGQPVPRSGGAITILFNGNKGDEKVAMTGWIMAHRLGHAIRRSPGSFGGSQSWENYVEEVNYVLREVLQAFNRMERMFQAGYAGYGAAEKGYKPATTPATPEKEKMLKYIAQQIGSFRSARMGKLRTFYEFYYELMAQWLITGGIKFNPLPRSLVVGKGGWGREEYSGAKDEDWLEQINEMLPDYAEGIESRLRAVFDGAVGKTFLM